MIILLISVRLADYDRPSGTQTTKPASFITSYFCRTRALHLLEVGVFSCACGCDNKGSSSQVPSWITMDAHQSAKVNFFCVMLSIE